MTLNFILHLFIINSANNYSRDVYEGLRERRRNFIEFISCVLSIKVKKCTLYLH